jgi:NDP-sugar pyrophosphorylase family protein
MKAVILAGGKGTRLRPYTTVFPKPLMPIGDKPILEIIIRQLKAQGFEEVLILVGYLGELITAFFGDGKKFGVNIRYYKEEQPLGTVGGLSLIRSEVDDVFLMINGDTLTTLNFSDFLDYHKSNGATATIALNRRQVKIDFGVVEVETITKRIKGYNEKPTLDNLVSMGVNAFNAEVMDRIEPDKYLDFPNLIHSLIDCGKTVKAYIFDGYWLDIGRPDDYERANAEIGSIYKKLGMG